MKHVMLYFGSFNPIHKGHIALAEYVIGRNLCDEVVLVVSPQSPHKEALELAPETDRFEMAEIACAGSQYPDRIKASVIEMLLPRPSYTIDTLRHLTENYGSQMRFSILLGGDQLARLDQWKEYEKILEYPLYIYPREGQRVEQHLDRIILLEEAPLQNYSSTRIRAAIERGEQASEMLAPEVADFIHKKRLWTPASRMVALNARLDATPDDTQLLVERGMLHYRLNAWGAALNDFNRVLQLDPTHGEAAQFAQMVQEILEFRYKDIYNP